MKRPQEVSEAKPHKTYTDTHTQIHTHTRTHAHTRTHTKQTRQTPWLGLEPPHPRRPSDQRRQGLVVERKKASNQRKKERSKAKVPQGFCGRVLVGSFCCLVALQDKYRQFAPTFTNVHNTTVTVQKGKCKLCNNNKQTRQKHSKDADGSKPSSACRR